ncbi:MAG: hypothetical protein AB7O67_13760 [Vicinamibacterales bacterium]
MNDVLLGVIAAAVSVMALIQVGAVVVALRLARRVESLTQQVEKDIKPVLANLSAVSDEAVRASRLAVAQVERLDELVGDFAGRAGEMAGRVEDTLQAAQQFVTGPARQGMAVVAGVRAAVSAIRGIREATRRRSAVRAASLDDDESLFIG